MGTNIGAAGLDLLNPTSFMIDYLNKNIVFGRARPSRKSIPF